MHSSSFEKPHNAAFYSFLSCLFFIQTFSEFALHDELQILYLDKVFTTSFKKLS